MSSWKSVLNGDPTEWLLEKDNPSVRYFALIDILERLENDPEVIESKREIMKTGVVPKILSEQRNGGYWETPENFYRAKYKGTVWQLIVLAKLGAEGKNEQVKKACEFIFENSQDRESGGFSTSGSENKGGSHDRVLPCLTGNMVWSLIRFGYFEDPRVQKGINWIVTYQRFDDGIEEKLKGWPYERQGHPHCWGYTHTRHVHTCHMGVVRALKALAEIPSEKRSEDVVKTIENGAEYMLKHHVYKRSHDLNRVSNPNWLKFGFPYLWQMDVLEVLEILTKLGFRDKRMQEAVDLVISKQDERGKWKLENLPSPQGTFYKNFSAIIEQKDSLSKWITLNALKVLKGFYS
jgi:hypothetical protein